jgi:hypothetical protein
MQENTIGLNVNRCRGSINTYRTWTWMGKMRGFTSRLVVRNRDVLGCLWIVSSGFGADGVEQSDSPCHGVS